MSKAESIKKFLDWCAHGYWIANFLLSLGFGRGSMVWLGRHVNISTDWRGVLWLIFSGAFFWLFAFLARLVGDRKRHSIQTGEQALSHQLPNVQELDELYAKFDSRITGDIVTEIQKVIKDVPEQDKIGHLIRAVAVASMFNQYEILWYNIFGSQISALHDLNSSSKTREQVFYWYSAAATASPAFYSGHSFERWLGFMRSQVLIREDGELINITVKGRDFLKYLIDQGRAAQHRAL